MELFAGIALALVLVLAGCGLTFLAGTLLPTALLEPARRHGRFAGLDTPQRPTGGGSGRAVRVWPLVRAGVAGFA